jgi:type II secretory pathway pseudopilin PulG
MTLLESLLALVILGLAVVATLAALETSSSAVRRADEWVEAVAQAEAVMEATKLGPEPFAAVGSASAALGLEHRTSSGPWLDAPGVNEVTVTVALPGGGEFTLRRLARVP